MYSQAGPSTSTASTAAVDAGPLPVKCGEIGYNPTASDAQSSMSSSEQVIVLPERHPADRDGPSPVSVRQASALAEQPTTPTTPALSIRTTKGAVSKNTIYGFRIEQVLVLCAILVVIIGTVAGWAILGHAMNSGKFAGLQGSASSVAVHISFGFLLVIQLFFLERRIFIARADRYARLHPDDLDPTSAAHPSTLAPWARPPLPTYAATLAQSGAGTGDVEDHIIAAPPPPAYGNTRGSTLLLSGILTEAMRRERPISGISRESRRSEVRSEVPRNESPLSYRSRDEEWEEYCDAQRARVLEETLTTLERPARALTRTH